MAQPFNARAVFRLKPDRLYRIYCSADSLVFVRIGGQAAGLAFALESQGGFIGAALAKIVRERQHAKQRQTELHADAFDPTFLLSRHRHNFRVVPGEIHEACMLPPGRPVHGPHVGRCHMTLASRGPLRLQFETPGDLALALEQLPMILGARLSLSVAPVRAA